MRCTFWSQPRWWSMLLIKLVYRILFTSFVVFFVELRLIYFTVHVPLMNLWSTDGKRQTCFVHFHLFDGSVRWCCDGEMSARLLKHQTQLSIFCRRQIGFEFQQNVIEFDSVIYQKHHNWHQHALLQLSDGGNNNLTLSGENCAFDFLRHAFCRNAFVPWIHSAIMREQQTQTECVDDDWIWNRNLSIVTFNLS